MPCSGSPTRSTGSTGWKLEPKLGVGSELEGAVPVPTELLVFTCTESVLSWLCTMSSSREVAGREGDRRFRDEQRVFTRNANRNLVLQAVGWGLVQQTKQKRLVCLKNIPLLFQ